MTTARVTSAERDDSHERYASGNAGTAGRWEGGVHVRSLADHPVAAASGGDRRRDLRGEVPVVASDRGADRAGDRPRFRPKHRLGSETDELEADRLCEGAGRLAPFEELADG